MREAFVQASIEAALLTNKRPTQSQVASIAGLSRLEIRKFSKTRKKSSNSRHLQTSTRLEKLIDGWTTDRKFLDSRRRPRALNVIGATSEFSLLAKRYGRDVTPRALIDQLVRMQFATEERGRIILTKDVHPRKADLQAVRSDFRFLLGLLSNFDWQSGRRRFSASKLALATPESKSAHLLRRTATTQIERALSAIKALSYGPPEAAPLAKSHENRVLIYVSIATETKGNKR